MEDYKDTLLMPKTEFKMRGNLAENEITVMGKGSKERIVLVSTRAKDFLEK